MLPTHSHSRGPSPSAPPPSTADLKYKSLKEQYLHIFFIVAAYWLISISTVFVNKSLLSQQQDFDGPIFVTWFQCIFTVGFCLMLKVLGQRFGFRNLEHYVSVRLSLVDLLKVLPLSIMFVGMVGFNNLCLKYVGVAFYYLARCLTTVTNVIFTFTILQKSVSRRAIACCAVIVVGYLVGIQQEGVTGIVSWEGVIYGVLASCFVSLNAIYTKKKLHVVANSVLTLNLYNNINATLLFLPIMFLTGELPGIVFLHQMQEGYFWFLMIIGGICGVGIGFVTALQIQATSPLTHNISGTAKACVQTILAVHWYNDDKSFGWWISNLIVLGGSGLYAKVQQTDMKRDFKKSARKSANPDSEKLLGRRDEV